MKDYKLQLRIPKKNKKLILKIGFCEKKQKLKKLAGVIKNKIIRTTTAKAISKYILVYK